MIPFGPYDLVRRLSVGGMAELFLAVHRDDPGQRPLVVKRILPQLATRADVVRMFLDEGRLTSHLHHENLVQVFDVGQVDDCPFIVLEYVDGLPLFELLRRQPERRLPNQLACWLLAEVCAGLAYAHERTNLEGKPLEIVHRDVSPDNILLSRAGEVKLVDFGIAKAASQLARTRPGQVKGKLAYMSPEQLHNARIDSRSDLFSAGLVLYEATVGKRAFSLHSEVDLLRALLAGKYPPPELEVPGYPPALAKIVAGCLAVSVDRRYQRAAELRRALLSLVPPADWAASLASLVAAALVGRPALGTASATASFVLDPEDLELLPSDPGSSRVTTAHGAREESQKARRARSGAKKNRQSPPPVPSTSSSAQASPDEPETAVVPAFAGITQVEVFSALPDDDPPTRPEVIHAREPEYRPDEDTIPGAPSFLEAESRGRRPSR